MNQDYSEEARQLMNELDRLIPPHSTETQTSADPLIQAARHLAQGPDIKLSAASLDRIEARLRARTIEMHAEPVKPLPPRPAARPATRRFSPYRSLWRYAVAACLILALVVSAGVTKVSASSLPGETLYPVKRAVESGRLALVSDNGEPGLRVDLASRRLDEFKALLERDEVYPQALEEADDHLDRALELMARGYGNRAALSVRVSNLLDRQTTLITQAVPQASDRQRQHLESLMNNVLVLQEAALDLHSELFPPTSTPTLTATIPPSLTPLPPTSTITPTASSTLTPTATPTASAVPSGTITPLPTNTLRPSQTVTYTILTPNDGSDPASLDDEVTPSSASPTRTPPGHGPTPGLGHGNAPGQGGSNPGNGNNGQPPGQQKSK
jgi:hypothetical protein